MSLPTTFPFLARTSLPPFSRFEKFLSVGFLVGFLGMGTGFVTPPMRSKPMLLLLKGWICFVSALYISLYMTSDTKFNASFAFDPQSMVAALICDYMAFKVALLWAYNCPERSDEVAMLPLTMPRCLYYLLVG
ncbi:hypothetical protein MKEN_00421100 [Mycena kentingensis (nom. inval.)]|nr:hypothetical protein MKEN_00421100 [Mycena kentingensis (nom. inval.)]